jgi:hypothetical protein
MMMTTVKINQATLRTLSNALSNLSSNVFLSVSDIDAPIYYTKDSSVTKQYDNKEQNAHVYLLRL